RSAMAAIRAAAGERVLFARDPHEARQTAVREVPRKPRDHRQAADALRGPDFGLLPTDDVDGRLHRVSPREQARTQLHGLPQMTTRRTAVKFIAGAGVGALFTPAPWRLVRDTALWSENWPGIPRPKRGPISAKTTVCTLCPA